MSNEGVLSINPALLRTIVYLARLRLGCCFKHSVPSILMASPLGFVRDRMGAELEECVALPDSRTSFAG